MICETVDRIRTSLRLGQYTNEASISQGVILPILQALDWPVFDTSIVTPEFSAGTGRVDYALRENTGRPKIFVEVKRVGQTDAGDKQLFEYAFHQGVPMAVLTDGHEWSFYLPGEEGHYEERRVYKLDFLARSPDESTERFQRYLQFQRVMSGEALSAAKNDYKDVARDRQIADSLPKAWHQLLSGPDEILVELLSDKVEDICGYKPNTRVSSLFIKGKTDSNSGSNAPIDRQPNVPEDPEYPAKLPTPPPPTERGFSYLGEFYPAKYAWQVVREILITFARQDANFLEKFAARKLGSKRRFVAKSAADLYPGRPDFESNSTELVQGWWMGTHYSRADFEKKIKIACEVADVELGKQLVISL